MGGSGGDGESEGEDERLGVDAQGRKRVVAGAYFGHSSFSGVAVVRESSVVPVKDLIRGEEELKIFAPLGCGSKFLGRFFYFSFPNGMPLHRNELG